MIKNAEETLKNLTGRARWWRRQARECLAGFCFFSLVTAFGVYVDILYLGELDGFVVPCFVLSLGCFLLWRTAQRKAIAFEYAARHIELLVASKFNVTAVEHHFDQAMAALNSLDKVGSSRFD